MELDADAAELVGVDLLAGGADHGRALDAAHLGLGLVERRVERLIGAADLAVVRELFVDAAVDARLEHEELLVVAELALRVIEDAHHGARREVDHVGVEAGDGGVAARGVEALLGELGALGLVGAVHALVVGDRRRLALVALEEERAGHVVEALELLFDAARGRAAVEREVGGPPVVVVAQGDLAGSHVAAHAHGRHVLLVGDARLVAEADRRRALLVVLGRVGEHAHRLPVLVGEVERDPGLFEHAGEENVVGLAVLHAVFTRLVLLLDLLLDVDAPLLEDLGGDVELGLELEDPVIAPLRSGPHPGHDPQVVRREALLLDAELVQLAADAPPDLGSAVDAAAVEGEARLVADDALEVDVRVPAERRHGHRERRRHRLVHAELAHVEVVVRRDSHLLICAHEPTLALRSVIIRCFIDALRLPGCSPLLGRSNDASREVSRIDPRANGEHSLFARRSSTAAARMDLI